MSRRLAVGCAPPMLAAMYDESRLGELEYQREQVRRHLEWLDREIAAERGKRPGQMHGSAVPAVQAARPASFSDVVPATATTPRQVEALATERPRAAMDVRQDVKKGCLLYFAAAIGAVVFTVVVLYFAFGIGRR